METLKNEMKWEDSVEANEIESPNSAKTKILEQVVYIDGDEIAPDKQPKIENSSSSHCTAVENNDICSPNSVNTFPPFTSSRALTKTSQSKSSDATSGFTTSSSISNQSNEITRCFDGLNSVLQTSVARLDCILHTSFARLDSALQNLLEATEIDAVGTPKSDLLPKKTSFSSRDCLSSAKASPNVSHELLSLDPGRMDLETKAPVEGSDRVSSEHVLSNEPSRKCSASEHPENSESVVVIDERLVEDIGLLDSQRNESTSVLENSEWVMINSVSSVQNSEWTMPCSGYVVQNTETVMLGSESSVQDSEWVMTGSGSSIQESVTPNNEPSIQRLEISE